MGTVNSSLQEIEMKTLVILYLTLVTSTVPFPQFGGFGGFGNSQNCFGSRCNQNNGLTFGGFGGFGGFQGFGGHRQNCLGSQCNQNNFGRRKRASDTVEISQDTDAMEPDTVEVSKDTMEIYHDGDTVEISKDTDAVEISKDTVETSHDDDTVDISRHPNTLVPTQVTYFTTQGDKQSGPFTFTSLTPSLSNLFPYLGFPWFSYSSSVQHNPRAQTSAESDVDSIPQSPPEETTAPESPQYNVFLPWFQSLSPTNASLHNFLFPLESSFPFGGR